MPEQDVTTRLRAALEHVVRTWDTPVPSETMSSRDVWQFAMQEAIEHARHTLQEIPPGE